MNLVNVVSQDAFNVISLSNFINDITPQYGRLGALGLFIDEGVTQNIVGVDYDPVTNQLLPQAKWGAPGVANKTATGKLKTFAIPHFPVNDSVLAADVMGRRAPGTNDTLAVQRLLGKKMAEMKLKLEQTLEWMRLGVLKSGLVKDGAGTTILDIYGDFGISQVSTSFVLGNTTTNVIGLVGARKRAILAALRGELMRGFVALCADDFFDAFTSHPNVKQAFQYYQANGQNLATDYSGGGDSPNSAGLFSGVEKPFIYGNVAWINYTGSVSDSAGNAQPMIDAGSAYMFPLGTQVFKTWFSPADYLETVNTEGLPFYAKQKLMDYDKGIDVECQSNPLPICLKPAVIQKVTIS
jgi:hypothetical protein